MSTRFSFAFFFLGLATAITAGVALADAIGPVRRDCSLIAPGICLSVPPADDGAIPPTGALPDIEADAF